MDHDETIGLMEIAAAEPDGLERLMAGDTPEAIAVAGHLAGCAACVAELAAIRRTAALVRAVVAEEPAPELRERTLDFVKAMGVDRSALTAPAVVPAPAEPATPESAPASAPVPTPMPMPVPSALPRRRVPWAAVAGLAAALVIGLVTGYGVRGQAAPVTGDPSPVTVLEDATRMMADLAAAPDVQRVTLVSTRGGTATGSLVFAPSTGGMAMLADGLAQAPDGAEYECWVEVAGVRRVLGELYPGGTIMAWSGPADVAGLRAGVTFGVTLRAANGSGEDLLTGSL